MPRTVKKVLQKKAAPKKVVKKITKKAAAPKKAVSKNLSKKVPFAKYCNGKKKMPMIGLGTFGSDHMSHENVGKAVKFAIENGYRLIDCASVYCNEAYTGKAMKACIKAGTVTRKELIVISKLAN